MARYDEDHDYTRLGRIYHNMKTRCTNPNYDKYKWYGGKGVSICDEWFNSYDVFEEWALSHGYADNLTLDRIDPDGDYTPDNCRWIDRKAQANNRTSNKMLTYQGRTQSLQQWAEELGISVDMLGQRLRKGWDVERALTEDNHGTNHEYLVTYKGKTQRIHEWAKELGMKYSTLHNRISYRKWPIERAIETPVVRRS